MKGTLVTMDDKGISDRQVKTAFWVANQRVQPMIRARWQPPLATHSAA